MSHNHNVNQCVVYEEQDETNKQECTAYEISMYDDKNCQSTKCVHMWVVKPATIKSDPMQSVKPAMTQSIYKKFSQVSLCDDKNWQYTKYLCNNKKLSI